MPTPFNSPSTTPYHLHSLLRKASKLAPIPHQTWFLPSTDRSSSTAALQVDKLPVLTLRHLSSQLSPGCEQGVSTRIGAIEFSYVRCPSLSFWFAYLSLFLRFSFLPSFFCYFIFVTVGLTGNVAPKPSVSSSSGTPLRPGESIIDATREFLFPGYLRSRVARFYFVS